MRRRTVLEELQLIMEIIADRPEGIGIAGLESELAERTGNRLNRRTLQRRLARLIAENQIASEGASTALRYKASPESTPAPPGDPRALLPLSACRAVCSCLARGCGHP